MTSHHCRSIKRRRRRRRRRRRAQQLLLNTTQSNKRSATDQQADAIRGETRHARPSLRRASLSWSSSPRVALLAQTARCREEETTTNDAERRRKQMSLCCLTFRLWICAPPVQQQARQHAANYDGDLFARIVVSANDAMQRTAAAGQAHQRCGRPSDRATRTRIARATQTQSL